MKNDQITISEQLSRISGLVAECDKYRQDLQHIQELLQETSHQHQQQLAHIRQTSDTALQAELHRIRTAADGQLETVQFDQKSQADSLTHGGESTAAELAAELQEAVSKLEERRNSETWILQSVLDEETHDSPIARFERAADTFVNQKTNLDERFETLQQQIEFSQQYL